jgi:hypothetical protein
VFTSSTSRTAGRGVTEPRQSRTDLPTGYAGVPVLKTVEVSPTISDGYCDWVRRPPILWACGGASTIVPWTATSSAGQARELGGDGHGLGAHAGGTGKDRGPRDQLARPRARAEAWRHGARARGRPGRRRIRDCTSPLRERSPDLERLQSRDGQDRPPSKRGGSSSSSSFERRRIQPRSRPKRRGTVPMFASIVRCGKSPTCWIT